MKICFDRKIKTSISFSNITQAYRTKAIEFHSSVSEEGRKKKSEIKKSGNFLDEILCIFCTNYYFIANETAREFSSNLNVFY